MTKDKRIKAEIKNLVIGRFVENGRHHTMTVDITLEQQPKKTHTVDHTDLDYSTRLSIVGDLHSRTKVIMCGQIYNQIGQLSALAGELTVNDAIELQRLWGRWHLNDMRPWSREMYDEAHAANFDYDALSKRTDSHGYVYGTAWLEEPLVRSEIQSLMDITDKARQGVKNPAHWHITDTIGVDTVLYDAATLYLDDFAWEA